MNKSRLIYLGVGQTSAPCKQGTGDPQTLPSISPIVDKGEHMYGLPFRTKKNVSKKISQIDKFYSKKQKSHQCLQIAARFSSHTSKI